MSAVTLRELERIIRDAWSAETSDSPGTWSPENPAYGQCGTTSYVLREFLGGDIVIAEIGGTDPQDRHAWLRLPSGLDIDITADQFTEPPTLTICDIPQDLLARKLAEPSQRLLTRVHATLAER